MSYLTRFLTLSFLFICSSVMAHSGHDHTSVMAGLIHVAWLAPMAFGGWLMFKKRHLLTSMLSKKS